MATAEELRLRAADLDEERRKGMAEGRFVRPDPDDHILATLPTGSGEHSEIRVSWRAARDRAPAFSVRLFVDEGWGPMPVRGVGYHVPFFLMADFARAVADGLELALQHQKTMRERNQWRRR